MSIREVKVRIGSEETIEAEEEIIAVAPLEADTDGTVTDTREFRAQALRRYNVTRLGIGNCVVDEAGMPIPTSKLKTHELQAELEVCTPNIADDYSWQRCMYVKRTFAYVYALIRVLGQNHAGVSPFFRYIYIYAVHSLSICSIASLTSVGFTSLQQINT